MCLFLKSSLILILLTLVDFHIRLTQQLSCDGAYPRPKTSLFPGHPRREVLWPVVVVGTKQREGRVARRQLAGWWGVGED